MKHKVTIFESCHLEEGQKIRIEKSPLEGDWEIIKVTPFKVTLRCPISKKELIKNRLFFVTQQKQTQWPKK